LRQMTEEFGFPELHAKKALLASDSNLDAAVGWLAEHESDPTLDEPIPFVPQVMS